jgi:integrase
MGVTIRERDGAWWVFVHHGGKRKSKRIGSKRAALEAQAKIQARLVLGDLGVMKEGPTCPTLKEYAERWLILPHDRKDSTQENYAASLRLYAYPALGKLRLDEITRKDLKGFFDKLLSAGKARGTVRNVRIALSGVLRNAVEEEILERNPLVDLRWKRAKAKSEEINPLTEEEADKLLEEARVYLGGRYYPAILCALRTGMRVGELEALRWGDVDFNGGFLEVRRSHRAGRVTATKTGASKRVDMSPMLVAALQELKAGRKVVSLEEDGWVFADRRGRMLQRKNFEEALHRCLERAGMRRIRVHDLRHTYATIRLLRGHNVIDVSRQLGHSSPRITLDVYSHWIPGKFKSEVAELDTAQPTAPPAQPATAKPHHD